MSAPVVVDDNDKVPKEKLSVEPSTNKSKFRLTVEPLGFLYVTARIIQVKHIILTRSISQFSDIWLFIYSSQ